MKYLEYALGIVGIVIGGALLILSMLFMAFIWTVLWVVGYPVRVTDEGGKTLGHYKWFTFYRSKDASSTTTQ
jgi:type IV secretory pathway VirB3-like protein